MRQVCHKFDKCTKAISYKTLKDRAKGLINLLSVPT